MVSPAQFRMLKFFVISPYPEQEYYNVAAAIVAHWILVKGMVPIEQQTSLLMPLSNGVCPQCLDAINVMVEIPRGRTQANGAHDLDDAQWEGWFDSNVQDSGAIMVGGSYGLGDQTVGRFTYGSRMDAQGWFERIVTTSTYEYADLFYPDDSRQAYTAYFGGTSEHPSDCIVSVSTRRFWLRR